MKATQWIVYSKNSTSIVVNLIPGSHTNKTKIKPMLRGIEERCKNHNGLDASKMIQKLNGLIPIWAQASLARNMWMSLTTT